MIAQARCNSYKLDLIQGVHQPGDEYRLALYVESATLGEDTTVYDTAGEVVGDGYIAGGRVLTGRVAMLEEGVAFMNWDNPVWDPATITARGGLIYNATRANKAMFVVDFGQNIISTNGPWTARFPIPSPATAVFRVD